MQAYSSEYGKDIRKHNNNEKLGWPEPNPPTWNIHFF